MVKRRKLVRLPSPPPNVNQANPATIYFVGTFFVLTMPLSER